MNKIFKVIFNKNTHQLVVVSELGKSKYPSKSSGNSTQALKNSTAIAILGLSTLTLNVHMAFAQDTPMMTSANQIDPNLIVGNDPTSLVERFSLEGRSVAIRQGEKSETAIPHLSHINGKHASDAVDLEQLKHFFLLGYIKGNANTDGTANNNHYWRSTIQIIGSQADASSHYSSDNLTTVYSKNGGADSTITIKMKDDPTFKQITLENKANPLAKTVVDENGIIIHHAGGKVSLTAQGLDNGNNPIRNVADGIQDTDAVNQRQLKAATTGLLDKGLKFTANSGNGGTSKLGSQIHIQGAGSQTDSEYSSENIKTKVSQDADKTTIDIMLAKHLTNLDGVYIKDGPSLTKTGIDAANKNIANVKVGEITVNSGDAINGSQFYALGNILGLTPNKTLTGFTPPTFLPLIKTNGDFAAEAIDYQTAINDLITKINQGFMVNGNRSFPGVTNQQYLGSTINIIGSTPNDGVTYSDKNLTTVYQKDNHGNGTITIKMSEMPNFEQITLGKNNSHSSHTIVDSSGIVIHSAHGDKVRLTEYGLDNGGNVITNVGKGVAPTDAVNKSQLDEAIKDSIIDVTDRGLLFGGNDGDTVTNKLGSEIIIKGNGHEDDHQYSGENIKTHVSQDALGKTTIDILLAKNLAIESVTAHKYVMVGSNQQNVMMKDNGIYIQHGPSLTVGGLDNGGKVISNVADGVYAQDAVTISQLEKVYNVIKDQLDKGLDFSGDTGGNVNTAIGSSVEILGDGQNIQTHVDKTANDKTKVNIQLNDHLHIKNITLKDDPMRSTTTINQEGIAIKSANGEQNVTLTSQGLDNGGNIISNVADGKAPTDAVNVKQLDVLANDVQDLKKNIGVNVGRALSDIHHQIKENRKESHAGIAAAIATANLPQSFSAGSSTVSAAIGVYRNQQAISIGLSRISDNGKWTVKSAITQDTQSNFGAGMGLGYNW